MDNYDLQVDLGKDIFLEYDQQRLIEKFRLKADSQWIYLTYMATPCRINRTSAAIEHLQDNAWQECRDYSTVMTIYDLLCYHQGAQLPPLRGQWCAVGSFIVAGITETDRFTGKYARLFQSCPERLPAACEALGGVLQPSMAGADLTCQFWVTDFFPVLLQFWQADEDFPPKLLLLWDRNTDQLLHFETTFYLQGDLLERLKAQVSRQPEGAKQ